MNIVEVREQQQKLVADARVKLDEIQDDTPEARAKEIEVEYDAIMAEYDKLDAKAEELEAREARRRRLDGIEEERSRPDPRRPVSDGEAPAVQRSQPDENDAALAASRRAAFGAYLRYGAAGMSREQRALLVRAPAEQRAQGTQVGTQGGYLVPEGFMAELIVSLKDYGPMMDGTIVREFLTATGNSIPWPGLDDTSNKGRRIPENTQVSATEVAFTTRTLEAYKYTSDVVLVANELLQDSVFDIEALLRNLMAERIGRIGNEEATTGSGASMPHGVATAAAAGVTAASASALVMDDLLDLEHSLDPAYRRDPSCRLMFSDNTLKAIRKLKDGEGRYLWQPADVRVGAPATLSGYPYSVNQDMAEIGTGNISVLFGAFNRYAVRKVREFALRRLVERYADVDQVGFIGFMRMDGELLDTKAIRRLVHP